MLFLLGSRVDFQSPLCISIAEYCTFQGTEKGIATERRTESMFL